MAHQDGDNRAQLLGSKASYTSQCHWSAADFPDYLQQNTNHTYYLLNAQKMKLVLAIHSPMPQTHH